MEIPGTHPLHCPWAPELTVRAQEEQSCPMRGNEEQGAAGTPQLAMPPQWPPQPAMGWAMGVPSGTVKPGGTHGNLINMNF